MSARLRSSIRSGFTSRRVRSSPAAWDRCRELAEQAQVLVTCHESGAAPRLEIHGDDDIMQALDAGCHVLGEKPISNEIPKAEQMVAKAREKKLLLWSVDQTESSTVTMPAIVSCASSTSSGSGFLK